MRVSVLNRNIGEATGWDELDYSILAFIFYDFKPIAELDVPSGGDLVVIFEDGLFEINSESGFILQRGDILDLVKNIKRISDIR